MKADLTGKSYGRLTVIGPLDRDKHGKRAWWCKCGCGNTKLIRERYLLNGDYKGCGCLRGCPTHGCSRNPITRPMYKLLERILQRCNNPNHDSYGDYGGRGIKVCDEWNHPSKFLDFLEHLGPRPSPKHTIERVNNDGHYEPGNVRWATRAEQQRNRRNNIDLTFGGVTLCRKDMAAKYGIPDWTVKKRLLHGWTISEALTIPVDQKHVHPKRAKCNQTSCI